MSAGLLIELHRNADYPSLEVAARSLIAANPSTGFAWKALGAALAAQGCPQEALEAKLEAVRLLPNDAEAHSNLGNALWAQGNTQDAEASYLQAITLQSDFVAALNNLGKLQASLGRWRDAIATLSQSLRVREAQPDTMLRLANAQSQTGDARAALAMLESALALEPDNPDIHNNLGTLHKEQGRMREAETCYRRAIDLAPDGHEAHINLGNVFYETGRLVQGAWAYRRGLALNPESAEAHNNFGNLLKDAGELDAAVGAYRRALALKPDFPGAHSNLLLALNYGGAALSKCLSQAEAFGAAATARATPGRKNFRQPAPGRLRVGLVSGDLRNHPVGYFLEGLLANIDPCAIELIAYPTLARTDELTERIMPRFTAWKPLVGLSDESAARAIRADGVDVLLDLAGHTAFNRLGLFAWRPAPVQASWLGYFATTGVAQMDFVMADEASVPLADRGQFTERVWYLSGTRLCFTPPQGAPQVAPLPMLVNGHVTFGSFQGLAKIGPGVLELWAKVLDRVPGSRLRLQNAQLGDAKVAACTLARLKAAGIDPSRVHVYGKSSRQAYLAAHAQVDIVLDTFPFPGGTTTCEALWMGVPTVTMEGDRLLSRQGSSLLRAAGLDEWVAADAQAYIGKAVHWANADVALARLREGLRSTLAASPLFDAALFAQHWTAALHQMHCWAHANS